MLCRHIFEATCAAARRGATKVPFSDSQFSPRSDPPQKFEREDGLFGTYDFVVACKLCSERREFDLIEEVWSGGRLHVRGLLPAAGERPISQLILPRRLQFNVGPMSFDQVMKKLYPPVRGPYLYRRGSGVSGLGSTW